VTHDCAGISLVRIVSVLLYSGEVTTFSYISRSVARQQVLATSLRLDNRAPLGAGDLCAPDLLLAKSGFGGLKNIVPVAG
jgi:hypothetical protein